MARIDYDSLPKEFIKLYFKTLESKMGLVPPIKKKEDDDTDEKEKKTPLEYAEELIDPSKNEDRFYKLDLSDGTKEIAKLLSDEEIVDFRKIAIEVTGSKVERSPAYMINQHMFGAFKDYLLSLNDLNMKKDSMDEDEYEKEYFENEARLHRDLLHIHPFEDYNGRTARTILTINLLKNGYAPAIIDSENKKEYISYSENNDIFGFRDFFRTESKKEEINLMKSYEYFINNEEVLPIKGSKLKK